MMQKQSKQTGMGQAPAALYHSYFCMHFIFPKHDQVWTGPKSHDHCMFSKVTKRAVRSLVIRVAQAAGGMHRPWPMSHLGLAGQFAHSASALQLAGQGTPVLYTKDLP